MNRALTEATILSLTPGTTTKWLCDGTTVRGQGRLVLRITPAGTKLFYFRSTAADGKRYDHPLGPFDSKGQSGIQLKEARVKTQRLQTLLRGEAKGDLRGYLQRSAQQSAAAQMERNNSAISNVPEDLSLQGLFKSYLDDLVERGKSDSAYDAGNMFKNHVLQPFPALAAMPAEDVTSEMLVTVFRRVVSQKHGRTAAKLRSYLHAAYRQASGASLNPALPAGPSKFSSLSNPLAPIAAMTQFMCPGHRTLSDQELADYMERLIGCADYVRDALMVHLYLAGQRGEQLLRARRSDLIESEGMTFLRLVDSKGRRPKPRVHFLPVSPAIRTILSRCLARSRHFGSKYIFVSRGASPLIQGTLSKAVTAIGRASLASKSGASSDESYFRFGDIRRTCETSLTAMGFQEKELGHLLSHGLSGVQDRHYNMHEYVTEKRRALLRWQRKIRKMASAELRGLLTCPLALASTGKNP